MKPVTLSDHYDVSALHETLRKNAQERESIPAVDLAELAAVASSAFHDAKSQGEGPDVAYVRAQAALAALEDSRANTDAMIKRAKIDLEREGVATLSPRREFFYEFSFAAIAPALALAVVYLLAHKEGEAQAKTAFATFSGAFLAAAFVALKGTIKKSIEPLTRLEGVLVRSGGAIAAGLCVFVVAAYAAKQNGERQISQQTEAQWQNFSQQAAVVTVAAIEADASSAKAEEAVQKTTVSPRLEVSKLADRKQGSVLLRAELPRTQVAELRLVSKANESTRVETSLFSENGQPTRGTDLFVGKVVSASLDNVTFAFEGRANESFALPKGTLPPPVGSISVAGVPEGQSQLAFVKPIDGLIAGLRK